MRLMETVRLIVIGVVLGIANVIPGVSGGTMAVVFNVYDRFLEVITLNIKKIISLYKFWVPLFIGIALGILGFSKILEQLFATHEKSTLLFFMGLIAGSLPLLFTTFKSHTPKILQFNTLIFFIVGLVLVIALSFLDNKESAITTVVQPHLTSGLFFKLFFSAILAALAMIIPGVSGSFLLFVLGVYPLVIQAVSEINIPILIPVVLGVIVGLLLGASAIRHLLQLFPAHTYAFILGLVIASLFAMSPNLAIDFELMLGSVFFVVGFFLAFLSSKTGKTKLRS